MRKLLLLVVTSAAVVMLVPATALAHHNGRRHHHVRVHHRTFGSDQSTGTTTPSPATATIVSFTNGVLTIKASDGNTASGMVTADTEIECQSADMSELRSHDQGGGGDDQGGDDQGQGDDETNQTCTSTDLVPGAMVQEAELTMSSAGAVWDKVELVAQPSSTTPVSDTDNDGD